MNLEVLENTKVRELLKENFVSMLGLFGSTARGEATSKSDIDLLVKFSKSQSLLSVIKLEKELEKILGKKVDLVTESSISPYLKKIILNELKIVYEEK